MAWPPLFAPRRPPRPALNLALQGGGAHGAFTWGVLDALLEADRFEIAALSGTSAGAMNAVLLAHGLMAGGPAGARAALEAFWSGIGSHLPFEWLTVGQDDALALNPLARLLMRWAQTLSPHELNPLGHDPLRDRLRHIDFEALRHPGRPRLAIAATHANSGRLQVFDNESLTLDALLASACLPALHHTVTIAGEPYWDGGYSANPAVFPLLRDSRCAEDTLLVLLAPRCHAHTPRKAAEIRERAVDIAFQAPFLRELGLLHELQSAMRSGWWPRSGLERRLAQARWHLVDGAPVLAALHRETRLIAHLPFLHRLRDAGRAAAGAWLAGPAAAVGRRSGVALPDVLGAPADQPSSPGVGGPAGLS
ncbi:patatin-like phospholipase family protein [Aquincola sp. MAHUQ-54]|uniref:Patatin-like phospholipase family protein n=1 Tax=Aquincola agrisoli TaxID=3119538 RepID=A0AAW9QDN0_9BURK